MFASHEFVSHVFVNKCIYLRWVRDLCMSVAVGVSHVQLLQKRLWLVIVMNVARFLAVASIL